MIAATRQPETVFRACADATRLRILNLLLDRDELCVCDLTAVLDAPQPNVSRHLAYLRRTGLVLSRRDGQWMHYRVAPPIDAVQARLLDTLRQLNDRPIHRADRARLDRRAGAACCEPPPTPTLGPAMPTDPCCSPGCCPTDAPADATTQIIRDQYAETARRGLSSDNASIHSVAEAFGYTADELAAIPAAANMGLSCGNPVALASLQPGEVVVDLGSGGGLDVFLAAQHVGPTGRVIGIDMTPDMIALAQRNAQRGAGGRVYTNVDFRLGTIDRLPLADASVDVVISNCVINLAPDKPAVFREMHRVLKPGGRVAVSDIALKAALPDELASNAAALVGCIAGAIPIPAFETGLRDAGFRDVAIIDAHADLTAYAQADGHTACCTPTTDEASTDCCTPAKSMHRDLADLFERYDVNAYAASVKVFALK